MKVLITGGTGMLGRLLVQHFKDRHRVLYTTHRDAIVIPGAEAMQWDLAQGPRHLPSVDAVVHTAAMTNVDECQRQPDQAYRNNVLATRNLTASVPGAHVVYISTDFVFDGAKGNYSENDPVTPLSEYGKTKLVGEAEIPADGCVIRSSIYGLGSRPQRPGLVEKLVAKLRQGETLTGFTDQMFTPISCANLALFIEEILARRYRGTLHVGNERTLTKLEFIRAIALGFGFDRERVQPGLSSSVNHLAPRPRDVSLVTGRARQDFIARTWGLDESVRIIRQQWEERG